jgi:hypothetical protein
VLAIFSGPILPSLGNCHAETGYGLFIVGARVGTNMADDLRSVQSY